MLPWSSGLMGVGGDCILLESAGVLGGGCCLEEEEGAGAACCNCWGLADERRRADGVVGVLG